MDKKFLSFVFITIFLGLIFRLYHIEFGLPHSFYADEPEIAELAIKYTYELKDIVINNNFYKLIPISYVYGTFPTYLFTVAVIIFSKSMNLVHIPFDKTTLFIFMRVLNAIISMGIPLITAYTAHLLFKKKTITGATLLLVALNWKLIVHAHYLNQDMFLVLLLMLSSVSLLKYLQDDKKTLFTILSGIFFGLAVGTKITALISIPLYMLVFVKRKDFYGLMGFLGVCAGAFIFTNPFSIIFIQDFVFRVLRMSTQEAGLVFDSVDSNPLKYFSALISMTTPIILVLGFYGKIKALRLKGNNGESMDCLFHLFILCNSLVYIIFYSIQSRRVDRWLLPLVPIIIIYAAYGYDILSEKFKTYYKYGIFALIFSLYMYYPSLLLTQFNRWTPKSEAYLWAKENLPQLEPKLVYTEEGLDPTNKLDSTKVYQFEVYESKGAQMFFPSPLIDTYKYVIISSRPMQNFKRKEVVEKFPIYAQRWIDFEKSLNDPNKYDLIKSFVGTKPNLIPLSDVFVYKKR
jgi:hypothetical protein